VKEKKQEAKAAQLNTEELQKERAKSKREKLEKYMAEKRQRVIQTAVTQEEKKEKALQSSRSAEKTSQLASPEEIRMQKERILEKKRAEEVKGKVHQQAIDQYIKTQKKRAQIEDDLKAVDQDLNRQAKAFGGKEKIEALLVVLRTEKVRMKAEKKALEEERQRAELAEKKRAAAEKRLAAEKKQARKVEEEKRKREAVEKRALMKAEEDRKEAELRAERKKQKMLEAEKKELLKRKAAKEKAELKLKREKRKVIEKEKTRLRKLEEIKRKEELKKEEEIQRRVQQEKKRLLKEERRLAKEKAEAEERKIRQAREAEEAKERAIDKKVRERMKAEKKRKAAIEAAKTKELKEQARLEKERKRTEMEIERKAKEILMRQRKDTKLLPTKQDKINGHLSRAQDFVEAGAYDKAGRELDEVLALDANNKIAQSLMGTIMEERFASERKAEARTYKDNERELRGEYLEAMENIDTGIRRLSSEGNQNYKEQKYAKANQNYRRVRALEVQKRSLTEGLLNRIQSRQAALRNDMTPHERDEKVGELMQQAEFFIKQERWDEAATAYESVFLFDPMNADASRGLDSLKKLFLKKEKAKAETAHRVLQEDLDNRINYYLEAAKSARNDGDSGASKVLVRKALALDPNNRTAQRILESLNK